MPTGETQRAVHKLAFKKVRHEGVVVSALVSIPEFGLFLDGKSVVELHFFVGRLCLDPVELIVHAVD